MRVRAGVRVENSDRLLYGGGDHGAPGGRIRRIGARVLWFLAHLLVRRLLRLIAGPSAGARTGVRITSTPSAWKTASKERSNLASRSWIRTRKRSPRSASVIVGWRACCVAHAPVGFAVTPARCTRLEASSMKNSA
jgi:hypothetical protein